MNSSQVKLTFLGSGSAFTVGENNFHSNILIEDIATSKKLLFDCGSDIRLSLHALGMSFTDIDAVYISHIHSDHTGGLEWLGFTRYFSGTGSPELYVPHDVVTPLWETLRAGMCTLDDQKSDLNTYFNVKTVDKSHKFEWMGYQFNLEKSKHVVNNGVDLPCYGLTFSVADEVIYISSDACLTYDETPDRYNHSTLIFHDCETLPFLSGVHANYKQLVKLPQEIKEKMWLYHFNPGDKPTPEDEGFKGFVQPGQTFLI